MAMDQTEIEFQRRCSDLVSREVILCMSSIVSTLATGYTDAIDMHKRDLGALCEQALDLVAPVEDCEEAARDTGWRQVMTESGVLWMNDSDSDIFDDVVNLCEDKNIETYPREVYEHWAVTQWFGEKLEKAGEKVDFDFAGLVVWARQTTGQAISIDGVIERIRRELDAC